MQEIEESSRKKALSQSVRLKRAFELKEESIQTKMKEELYDKRREYHQFKREITNMHMLRE